MLTPEHQQQCATLWPSIRTYIRRWAKKDDEVESVADVALCEAVRKFDPARGLELLPWVKMAVHNEIQHYFQRKKRERKRGLSGGAPTLTTIQRANGSGCRAQKTQENEDVGKTTWMQETIADTHRGNTPHALFVFIFDRLPTTFKTLTVELATQMFFFQRSVREIAALMGRPWETIRYHWHLLRDAGRHILETYDPEATHYVAGVPEPTQGEQCEYAVQVLQKSRAYGRPPDVEWTYESAPYRSIPLDAWLQQGKPHFLDARDIPDDVYERLQREKYPTLSGNYT